jgi:hypothetical protein
LQKNALRNKRTSNTAEVAPTEPGNLRAEVFTTDAAIGDFAARGAYTGSMALD